nr:MAG TPA: hypothetical protein [Caudoviricetes sp.]DAW88905.1 MAG TPA: hypothetical protein [Caudoviricetes sp.]
MEWNRWPTSTNIKIPSILVSLACVGSTSYKVETVAEENQINGKCGLFINN